MGSDYFCRHKLLELIHGEHRCVDCDRAFDLVPIHLKKREPQPANNRSLGDSSNCNDSGKRFLVWGAIAVGIVALLIGLYMIASSKSDKHDRYARNSSCEPEVIEKTVEIPVEKIVEVKIPAKCDTPRETKCPEIPKCPSLTCPDVEQAICKPETVYVPQKSDCTKEIEVACGEYKQALRFFHERGADLPEDMKDEGEDSFELFRDDYGEGDLDEEF